mmetsp:Transcript_53027/g.126771  ORF Transcript_53027/g.126771 Transcript_53027/m.126771 type:complete len:207 (-) Transcript_53027:810-1430(-)
MIRRLANHQLTILEAEDAGGLAVPEGVGQHLHALVLPDGGTAIAGAQINAADRASNARWRRRREEEIEARRRSFLLQWHLDGHQHVAAAAHGLQPEAPGHRLPFFCRILSLLGARQALRGFQAHLLRAELRLPHRLRRRLGVFRHLLRLELGLFEGLGTLLGALAAFLLRLPHAMPGALRLEPAPRDATILQLVQEELLVAGSVLL